jgi:leader peptidase (prepilin peptidase)/N-methyltransferase
MGADFWILYWAFVAFVFGAVTGSFLNVCIWRMPRGESLSDPPSHCPNCNHRLAFFPDMVPLLSQLWYRSRCRYCKQPFSWRYFWVEVFTALLFVAVYYRYAVFAPNSFFDDARNWSAMSGMIFIAALVTIFFIDLEHYQIPDLAVLVAVVAAVVKDAALIHFGHRPLWQSIPGTPWSLPLPLSIVGALLAFWFLWQFAALTTALLGREAMGAGDSLLLAAMASFLIPGPLVVIAFIFAVALGTVGGLAGMWFASRAEQAVTPGATAAPPDLPATGSPGEVDEIVEESQSRVELDETFAAHRGAVDAPADPEEPGAPTLPPDSRWGRVWTVLGTWLAVGGLWGGTVLAVEQRALGIGVAVIALVCAALALRHGLRLWAKGDPEWLPEMDEFFETDPGPRFIPFGPYLVAGTFFAMFCGKQVIYWYATSQLGLSPDALASLPWD